MCRAACSVPEEALGTNACQRKGFYNLLCVRAIVLVGSLTPISAWLTTPYGKSSFTLETWEGTTEGNYCFQGCKHSPLIPYGRYVTGNFLLVISVG